MVAKINRGKSLLGAIKYNLEKVDQGNGSILSTSKIIESADGSYNIDQFSRSFQPYLMANRKTEKPILHISLNPDPKDKVSADTLRELAQDYMRQMGYSNQPFAVFKHTDIDRTHIHIVSVCVNEQGKKISDTFEKKALNGCLSQIGTAVQPDKCHTAKEKRRQYDISSC
ncbi:relaxase/mobilization nuclease domain-containing protein [Flavobacterium sp. J372]|uniref:relaxase/mobilization nuclease domain-containing protein n=1 Tax=Flavobacterium sp. J372 TaxID=2898436 RepID=UPI0027E35AF5|nr:relaxase/mobilization nuclease domain-containing protein [Flavobacterium sp. J372]